MLADRRRELAKSVGVEDRPRLLGIGLDVIDGNDADTRAAADVGVVGRQQAEDRGRELAVLGQATGALRARKSGLAKINHLPSEIAVRPGRIGAAGVRP